MLYLYVLLYHEPVCSDSGSLHRRSQTAQVCLFNRKNKPESTDLYGVAYFIDFLHPAVRVFVPRK